MARKNRNKKYRKATVKPSSTDETLAKLDALTKQAKIAKKQKITVSKSPNQKYIAMFAITIIFGGFVGYFAFFGGNTTTPPTGGEGFTSEVNFLICEHGGSGDHYHFNLEIYIDGIKTDLPSDVGRTSCVRPIHTHPAELNKIHVELPVTFTERPRISDFFTVYQDSYSSASLSTTELMGVKGNVTATVDNVDLPNFILYTPLNLEVVRLYVNSSLP